MRWNRFSEEGQLAYSTCEVTHGVSAAVLRESDPNFVSEEMVALLRRIAPSAEDIPPGSALGS
jgi:hypothetical protein